MCKKRYLIIIGFILLLSTAVFAQLNESFTGTIFPPDGWTKYNYGTAPGDSWDRYTVYFYSAPACARIYYDLPNNDWLITPKLAVSSGNSLTFKWRKQSTSYEESLYIRLSTANTDTSAFTIFLDSVFGLVGDTTWHSKEIDLSAYAGNNVYIAFYYRDYNNFGVAIDDVTGPPIWAPPNDVGLQYIISPGSRHLITTSMTPSARVKNYGANNQNNFAVSCSIISPTGLVRHSNTKIISLASGRDTTINFTSWTPTIAELCSVKMRTALVGDQNPDNDRKAQTCDISSYIVIGTGTLGSAIYVMYGYYAYSVSEAIYLQSEIGHYGTITNLAYYKTVGTLTTQFDDVRIYMRHTTATSVSTGAYDTTGYTLVYSGAFPFNAIGWMDVPLTTPFNYNNSDNLQVLVIKGPPAITSGYPSWQYTSTTPNYQNRYANSASVPTSLTQTYSRPNIRIALALAPPPAKDVGVQAIIAPSSVLPINTPITPIARVKNYGSATQSFPVICSIIGPASVVRYIGSGTVTNLASLDTARVSFAPQYTPQYAELESVFMRTNLTNDSVPQNNRMARATVVGNIMLQDFEASNGGYIADPATAAWEWGTPTSGPNAAWSGTKVWATILAGNYTASANWKLTSSVFTAQSNNPVLMFWHWFDTEVAYDGGNVKISTDGGSTFTLITPDGGYPGTANSSNVGIPLEPCFTGHVQGFWEPKTFVLPVNSGQTFMIRWHFGSDASVFYTGWYIDDVVGINFNWTGIAEDKPTNLLLTSLNTAKPNPVTNGLAKISFNLAKSSQVNLSIYDVSGRRVKTLVNSHLEQGIYTYNWNGKDDFTREVAEGIYFYTLTTDNTNYTKKLVFTR